MRQVVMSAGLLAMVGSAAGAQQTAKAFVAPAIASTTRTWNSNLSLAEQMRRRPDILNSQALDVNSRFGLANKTQGETVLMSSDEKTF